MSFLELFNLAGWQSKDHYKSTRAVDFIYDQSKLAKIAKKARTHEAREAAVKKLREQHQALFADIARNDGHYSVSRVAACKLTDQILLADIAKHATYGWTRYEALKRLDQRNQTLIADLAKNDDFSEVRRLAVEKLDEQHNQILLSEIAKVDKNNDIRRAAVTKLNEQHQTLFFDLAKNDTDVNVRSIAFEKLSDEMSVAYFVCSPHYNMIDFKIAGDEWRSKISDREALLYIINNNKHSSNRLYAAKKLGDSELIAKFKSKHEGKLKSEKKNTKKKSTNDGHHTTHTNYGPRPTERWEYS